MGKYVVDAGFGPDTPIGSATVYRMTLGRTSPALHDPSPSFTASERDDMRDASGGTLAAFVAAMPAGVAAWFNGLSGAQKDALRDSAAAY